MSIASESKPAEKIVIDFMSAEPQTVGIFGDLRKYYDQSDPGLVYATVKPVVYNEFAIKHLVSDVAHQNRISWIENNQSDFIRAIQQPDIIEKTMRLRQDGHYSVTHIVKVSTPMGEKGEYMSVAISLSKEAGHDGFHQLTTIHPLKLRDIFDKNNEIKRKYVQIK